ncbi:MAG: hypothetical protein RDV00_04100 [Clostridia bacterium]|nr:hypothetical protein [Clostridia bacterium]
MDKSRAGSQRLEPHAGPLRWYGAGGGRRFDFEEALRDIHIELESLNAEAADWVKRPR